MAEQRNNLEQRTMHVFISRALQKILRECPKKHTALRQACTEVIGTRPITRMPVAARAPLAVARALSGSHPPLSADELKKNGAESFPAPEHDHTPPSTPPAREQPTDPSAMERATDAITSAK